MISRRALLAGVSALALSPAMGDAWTHGSAGGGTTSPNLAALPVAAGGVGNWNGFPGVSWVVNATFVDVTGVTMRRLTDATHPVSNLGMNMEYATGGPRISRPFGTNLDTYHVAFLNGAGGGGSESIVIMDVQRGVGYVNGSYRTTPTLPNGILGYCFSQKSSEPHIIYFSDKSSPDLIHRYDLNANAYSPNSIFNGTNASISAGGNIAGWLTQNWAGTAMSWVTPTSSPTALHFLDLTTGVLTSYTGVEIANVNDIRLCKGSAQVATSANNNGSKSFWFVPTNVATAPFASQSTQGHSDMGETYYYVLDADDANFPLLKVNVGTAPATDGGVSTASEVRLYDGGGNNVLLSQDQHPNMNWDQTGKGTGEYYCFDSDAGTTGTNNRVSANAWTLFSGSIYQTSVTFGSPQYGSSTRGVNGVVVLDGSGNFIGNLTAAASRAAMTAGTFFWDSVGTKLYVWMSGGGSPVGVTRLVANAKIDEAIGYAKQDGTDARKLCYTYRNENASSYETTPFTNWSPDGKIALFGSNLGVSGGRVDLIMVEVPVA